MSADQPTSTTLTPSTRPFPSAVTSRPLVSSTSWCRTRMDGGRMGRASERAERLKARRVWEGKEREHSGSVQSRRRQRTSVFYASPPFRQPFPRRNRTRSRRSPPVATSDEGEKARQANRRRPRLIVPGSRDRRRICYDIADGSLSIQSCAMIDISCRFFLPSKPWDQPLLVVCSRSHNLASCPPV